MLVKGLWYNFGMKTESRTGFTLVELSISLIFVGLLSLAMMFMINDAIVAFRRSNMLGQVNTVGMDLVDDMTMAVRDSTARVLTDICSTIYNDKTNVDKCKEDNAYNFVSVTKNYGKDALPIYGVFCTGTYSYIWNSGYFEKANSVLSGVSWIKLRYKDADGKTQETSNFFKLIKFRDDARSACIAAVYSNYDSNGTASRQYVKRSTSNGGNLFAASIIDITKIGDGMIESEPVDLLASGGANELALYDLVIARPAVRDRKSVV